MLNKRSKTKEDLYNVILFMYGSKIGKIKLCSRYETYTGNKNSDFPWEREGVAVRKGAHRELLGYQEHSLFLLSGGYTGVHFIPIAMHICVLYIFLYYDVS